MSIKVLNFYEHIFLNFCFFLSFKENLKEYLSSIKTINELKIDNFIQNKLNTYIMTDSIRDLIRKLDIFCMSKSIEIQQQNSIDLKSEKNNSNENASTNSSNDEQNQTEEYLEILKLRHINLAR